MNIRTVYIRVLQYTDQGVNINVLQHNPKGEITGDVFVNVLQHIARWRNIRSVYIYVNILQHLVQGSECWKCLC